jgi:acyl-CoA synthetase (NDP forming)
MLISELINPKNIAVIGASENESKPGGKILRNLLNNNFVGDIYAVNPKKLSINGIKHVTEINNLIQIDLAILVIPAKECLEAVKQLILKKTKAFIVFSAGFSEVGNNELENELIELISSVNGVLIGPNCIGTIQKSYKGVFTTPIPTYYDDGCELISSSGATAVFIMESAILTGLKFSNVYSIGNGIQTGVEEILEHMDLTYIDGHSPKIKLLYLEQIKNPFKFLKHATSLIQKGCKIAAIKSGVSLEGSRAASSHTGALATSDAVIRSLFDKCGIVYCSSREELISVAGVYQTNELKGENIAIITHAGGSAVMLTDALSTNGMQIPQMDKNETKDLLKKLNPGSSVENPFDFLATGNAEQLGEIIDFCEDNSKIDAMVVVFGSPGLFNVKDVYKLLLEKMNVCKKPIYTVLPSVINAKKEIEFFLSNGKICFSDEVTLGRAMAKVYQTNKPKNKSIQLPTMDFVAIRNIINASKSGFLNPKDTNELIHATGIEIFSFLEIKSNDELLELNNKISFPIVMKVNGPIHKTEVDGVRLNIQSIQEASETFQDLMKIEGVKSIIIQQQVKGEELYCGASKQGDFGHLILAGLGGIFLELLNDTVYALAPIDKNEATEMIKKLKGYPIIEGYRNKKGLNKEKFVDIIERISALVYVAPEISELDLNPIIAFENKMIPVDIRIKIDK